MTHHRAAAHAKRRLHRCRGGVKTRYENADEFSGAIAEPLAGNPGEDMAEEHCAGGSWEQGRPEVPSRLG
jgi:hypothetical protein